MGRANVRASRERESGPSTARVGARLKVSGKTIYLGRWPTQEAADVARDRFVLHLGLDLPLRRPDASRKLGPATAAAMVAEAHAVQKQGTSSRYLGVRWEPRQERWIADAGPREGRVFIGSFDDEVEAARAHDRVAMQLLGDRAKLNFPRGTVRAASVESVRKELRAQRKASTTSRFIGVWKDSARTARKWLATLSLGEKTYALGRYRTEREAAVAFDRAALWYGSTRTPRNFPDLPLEPASAEMLVNELLHEVKKGTTSRFIGVCWNGFSFIASACSNGTSLYLGSFDDEAEAARAHDRVALRESGPNAKLNFDPETGEELVGWRIR